MRAALGTLGLLLMCSGCAGPRVPVVNVDDSTAVELSQNTRVYRIGDTPAHGESLGPVTAHSCKNLLWDKAASEEDAINQLRVRARQRGGNAVGNLICESPRGTSTHTNCWEMITCHGNAMRIDASSPGLSRRR